MDSAVWAIIGGFIAGLACAIGYRAFQGVRVLLAWEHVADPSSAHDETTP